MPGIQETLESIRIGQPSTFRNLTLFAIIARNNTNPDYVTLDEAIGQKTARVTEVSAGGSVPELRFVNDAESSVFLLDGEELIGAKQNRVLNVSILAPARQSVVIPVSCVEQGRWNRQSSEFVSSPNAHYATGRALKMAAVTRSMSTGGGRRSDQAEVWQDIGRKFERVQSQSTTHAMSSMFEDHGSSLEQFVRAFPTAPNQAGAVFAINGSIVGLELFDAPATYQKLMPKLIRSYGLDAIDLTESGSVTRESPSVEEFLKAVCAAQEQAFPAIGEGEELRLTGSGVVGSALVARDRMAAFRSSQRPDQQRLSASQILRASLRSRALDRDGKGSTD